MASSIAVTPVTSKEKVTYSSSNKKVATVSSKGVIKAKKAGTAKITVKSGSKKVVVTVKVTGVKTTNLSGVPAAKSVRSKQQQHQRTQMKKLLLNHLTKKLQL